jgi:peroxiredoxin
VFDVASKPKPKVIVDWLASLAMIAASIVLIRVNMSGRRAGPPPFAPPYKVGDTVSASDGIGFKTAPKTLLVWLSSQCKYCQESVPFYQRLTKTQRGTRMVAVSYERRAAVQEFLDRHELKFDGVFSEPALAKRLRGTPEILLVGQDSTVLRLWMGKLSPTAESEVEAVVAGGNLALLLRPPH